MNRHGRRFVDLRDFKSHANSLNVKFLKDDELEFYEKHCLLLPAVVRHQPIGHLVAVTQSSGDCPVENPEDLEPSEALRRLQRPHTDGLHPFDAEREHNPLLRTPDCTTFEPWDTDDKVTLTAPGGRTVQRSAVERFYSPWQVHVVELLRQRRYYYAHSRFLRHIDPVVAGSVVAGSVVAGSVVAGSVVAGSVVAGSVVAGSVVAGSVVAGSVVAGSVVAGSVVAGSVVAGSVVAGSVVAGSVVAGSVVAGSVVAGSVVAGSVVAVAVTAGAFVSVRVGRSWGGLAATRLH